MYHSEISTWETWRPLSTYCTVHIVVDVVNGIYNQHVNHDIYDNDDAESLRNA